MANFDRYRVKHVGIRNSPALESAKTAKFSAIYNFLEGGEGGFYGHRVDHLPK